MKIDAALTETEVISRDGTRIGVWVAGDGPNKWLLPPALGAPVESWKFLFEHFADRMTIVTWDPRTCFGSDTPPDADRLGIEDHVDDGMAVLRAVGWQDERFFTGGWSMGVQVGLELYSRLAPQIVGMALLNGAFEHLLQTAFSFPMSGRLYSNLARGMSHTSAVINPVARWVLNQNWTGDLLDRLNLVAVNNEHFTEVMRAFRKHDFGTYFRMMDKVNDHSARHILPTVTVPTLITAGSADRMTPVSVAEVMHETIEDSELFVVEGGTHYTTLEFPTAINARLEEFFRHRVFVDSWDN